MAIRSGRMRHRIQIQVRDMTPTATGEQGATWSVFLECFAEVQPMLGGNEIVIAQQQEGRVPTRFRIRWRDGIEPRMRVVWPLANRSSSAPRWFDIKEVQMVDGIRHELLLVTEELVEVPL